MSLRTTLVTSLSLAICLFTAVSWAIQRGIVLPSFLALEREFAEDNLARVLRALDNEVAHLDAFVADWGAWDDTYAFIETPDDEYISANLTKASFENGNFTAAYYVASDGRVVWGQARAPEADFAVVSIPEFAGDRWPLTHPLLANRELDKTTSGIVATARGPMLVSSHPIITSQKEGPMRGWLVLAEQLTEESVTQLGLQTSLYFDLRPWTVDGLDSHDAAAFAVLQTGSDHHLEIVDDHEMRAYAPRRDVHGNPVLLVRVTLSREITSRGDAAIVFALWSSVGASALLLVALVVLLGRNVVDPIARLTAHAVQVGESDDLRARLGSTRRDEIGALAREFDSMVDRLAESRAKLVDLARQGGRSEVATSVLHNVGNVLNSVNVSKDLLQQRLLGVDEGLLDKLSGLLARHEHDLADFIARDPAGRNLPRFLTALVDQIGRGQRAANDECAQLGQSIDHLRALVTAQQDYAGHAGVAEFTSMAELVEQAIRVASARESGLSIRFERDIEAGLPELQVQRHRVLEVLVNLLCNACDAVEAARPSEPRVVVRLRRPAVDSVRIVVEDNGVGIAADVRTKLFQHGFTTKPGGHGFGLHASAIVMRELGGQLSFDSDGVGRGARFTIDVPVVESAPLGIAGGSP